MERTPLQIFNDCVSVAQCTLQTEHFAARVLVNKCKRVYWPSQLSARRMKEWTTAASPGRLIIIGSVMADYPYLIETSTAYNMAKASTDALTKTIASSLARHYITVNSIHPGWIDTQGERQFTSSEDIQAAGKHLPYGVGRPEDIAKGETFPISCVSVVPIILYRCIDV
eukprot:m.555583 g.555583  ORF g.555583 m.555583 type:complete len:169 (+) comp22183_c0_seq8:14-520(+)